MRQSSRGALQERYIRVTPPGGRIGLAVNRSSTEALGKVDAVAFDCDGVLIDARKSYDATITMVVETMVEGMTGVRLRLARVAPRLISMVRRTGGFNSDWDTSYALSLFSVVALEQRKDRSGLKATGAVEALTRITAGFGAALRERGQEAVDSFLTSQFPSMKGRLDRSREFLEYPRTPPEGRMTTLFDELYFGASLFEKVHGVKSSTRTKGLIELERILVDRKTLETLQKKLGGPRLAMITGRPFVGTAHSLGRLMRYFDKEVVRLHRGRGHRPGPAIGVRQAQEAEPGGPRQGQGEALLGDASLRWGLGRGPDDGPKGAGRGGSMASFSRGSTRRHPCRGTKPHSSRGRAPTSSSRR